MIIVSRRVAFPDGLRPATLHIRGGRISDITDGMASANGGDVMDFGDLVVFPGLVDTHVHINEPGRTDWEGFASATRAAAAGGVTTLVDMPLNSVPATTTVPGLGAKRQAAQGQCHVNVAFWGGVVPGNHPDLEGLARAGVRGFKCFLSPSGVEEFPHVGERDLNAALPVIGRLGLPLLVHAEWPDALRVPEGNPRDHRTWLESRPPAAEIAAIELVTRLARECNARVHIVHLATGEAVPLLRSVRGDGRVTVETCPHYLTFCADEIEEGATMFKCAPPIRDAAERAALWRALLSGDIDLIATDHSPAPPPLKEVAGDFVAAWGGIASLQLGLSAVWTGAHARGVDVHRLATWMSERPAQLAGLYPRKGTIAVGSDADLTIWDPDDERVIDARTLYHRHAVTPYDGRRLRGRVHATILGGQAVFADGRCRDAASGQLL